MESAVPDSRTLESISDAIIVLFVLSLAAEKLSNLIKLNIKSLRESIPNVENSEKKRERAINWITVGAGILIAFVSDANIFAIFSAGAQKHFQNLVYFGNNVTGEHGLSDIFIDLFGYIVTGLFLSFGSKFWHDVLDIVFEYKKLRKKLADESTYTVESVGELKNRLIFSPEDAGREANERINSLFARNKGSLFSIHQRLVGYGDNQTIEIDCSVKDEESRKLVPESFQIDRYQVKVITRIVSEESLPAASNSSNNNALPIIGNRIYNKNKNVESFGTVGCLVRGKSFGNMIMGLTCYHVARNKHPWSHYDRLTVNDSDNIGLRETGKIVGTFFWGRFSAQLDIALVDFEEGLRSEHPTQGKVSGFREISSVDTLNGTSVRIINSATEQAGYAWIYSNNVQTTIKYGNEEYFVKTNLFTISRRDANNDLKAPTKGGDSGSAVVDSSNRLLGIVIAADKSLTYVIPFSVINKLTGLEPSD